MSKVVVMDHPLIQHKIGYIRRKQTGTKDFRQTISEIAMLICYEATRELQLSDIQIETPICTHPPGRAWNGGRRIAADSGGKDRAYRVIQRSGDVESCGILLQASGRLRGKGSVCGRSHAGDRGVFRGGYSDVEGQRVQKYSFYVHYSGTGRSGADAEGASGRGYVYRRFG